MANPKWDFGLGIPSLAYIEPLWWITTVTTIGSGIGYIDGTGIRRLSKPNIGRLGKKLDEYDQYNQELKDQYNEMRDSLENQVNNLNQEKDELAKELDDAALKNHQLLKMIKSK